MPRTDHAPKTHPSATRLLPEVARQSAARPARNPPTEATILLVDDDLGVLVSLARVLMAEGWRVITATNGEEALERLSEHQPDLMITDLAMGDISGWDLLFHETLQRPTLPIFVITAHPPTAFGGGVSFTDRFFQKPLDLEALVQAIRAQLNPAESSRSP